MTQRPLPVEPRMPLLERFSYAFVPAPFLVDFLAGGGFPGSWASLAGDLLLSCIILVFVLLIGRTRRRTERIDGLRRTMSEAIIHDLKNPMTSVMCSLSAIIAGTVSDKSREKLARIALHSCRSQMRLLETLVDTGRLEAGELAPRLQVIATRGFLEECLAEIKGVASYLRVRIKSAFSPRLPETLYADQDLVPRALFNLLHNALKYTPPGGLVSLKADYLDRAFRFEVQDNGIGIAPEHISRLFQKYYRVEGGDQSGRRGSGLGLYFCRLVVESHGGEISVTSGVGRGTTIAFSIPQNGAGGGAAA